MLPSSKFIDSSYKVESENQVNSASNQFSQRKNDGKDESKDQNEEFKNK